MKQFLFVRVLAFLLASVVFCIETFLPLAVRAQSSDGTDQFLLKVAAPNRTVGSDDRPNVLFIVVDDLNVALGSYLDSAPHPQYATARTPNLDRLAAEGIRFEYAYAQNPVCNPSRASFLSGLRPSSTNIYGNATYWRNRFGDDLRLLPEHFHDYGYFTARVGKIGHNSFEHAMFQSLRCRENPNGGSIYRDTCLESIFRRCVTTPGRRDRKRACREPKFSLLSGAGEAFRCPGVLPPNLHA
jgi:hypothetical protein